MDNIAGAARAQESDVDRMIREARESRQAANAVQQRLGDFYEGAIDYAVGDVAMPICEGMKLALGNVSPIAPAGRHRGSRTFTVSGHSASSVSVELTVTVSGAGQIRENPRELGFSVTILGTIIARGRAADQFAIRESNANRRPIPSAEFIRRAINDRAKAYLGL